MKWTILVSILCAVSHLVSSTCSDCLILTPYIENGRAREARRLSEINSNLFYGHKSHSGFMTVTKQYNNNLFFWYFPVETKPVSETPLIIWLSGGPGVSSLAGLFGMLGPVKIEKGEVKERNITWASDYSLVFVDNPVGAGFSFTDDDRGYTDNEDDVGAQLLEFLVQFLKMFPELRSAPLFVSGQSYAGKYVPALGIQIHRYNNELKYRRNEQDRINLKGLTIGNGIIELRNIMHYSDLCRDLAFLDSEEITYVEALEEETVNLIDNNQLVDAANKFNETIEYIKKKSGINVYNFLKDPSPGAPDFEEYVNRPDIRKQIHVGDAIFDYNNQHVYYKMLPDFANSTKPFVSELLENYGVMYYGGQLDVILPYGLAKYMLESIPWSRRDEYISATRHILRTRPDGNVVGYKKSGGNLVDIMVRGAGHQVPGDQPEVAKFIIDKFIEEFK